MIKVNDEIASGNNTDETDSVMVYGCSDDLIEIEGVIEDEYCTSGGDIQDAKYNYVAFSDGTVLEIEYTSRGWWSIHVKRAGKCRVEREQDLDAGTDVIKLFGPAGSLTWALVGNSFLLAQSLTK